MSETFNCTVCGLCGHTYTCGGICPRCKGKKLKSVEQHNTDMMNHYTLLRYGSSGVACPKCEYEMVDSIPNMVLTSDPPQKHVHCPNCNYSTTIIV
jgi:uncharacterized protein YbaR (Trm112 family)